MRRPNSGSLLALMVCLFAVSVATRAAGTSPSDQALLQGTWTVTAAEQGGKPFDVIKGGQLTIAGDDFSLQTAAGNRYSGKIVVNSMTSPRELDFQLATGPVWLAIYSVDAQSFRLNYVEKDDGVARPKVFATTADTAGTVILMHRNPLTP